MSIRLAAQDEISYMGFAVSSITLAFIAVEGGQYFFGVAVALFLILIGLSGSAAFKLQKEAEPPTESESINLALFTSIAVTAFAFFGYIVPQIQFSVSTQTISYQAFFGNFSFDLSMPNIQFNGSNIPSWVPSFLFIAVLIPNAEEQFFGGFIGNLVLSRLGYLEGFAYLIVGIVGQAAATFIALVLISLPGGAIFGLFHTPAYNGNVPTIISLTLDRTIMIALDSITGRLSTSILAHMANNSISFFLKKASILSLFLPVWQFPTMLVFPLLIPSVMLAIALYKNKGKLHFGAVRIIR